MARLVAAARPTTGVLIVRGATPAAWPQDRSCRLGVTVWCVAGDRAPVEQLQADLVGLVVERGLSGVSASKPGAPGWSRAVTRNSNPLLKADMPVIAIVARSDRPNSRVLIGTMPGTPSAADSMAGASEVAVLAEPVVTCERGAWNQRCPGAPAAQLAEPVPLHPRPPRRRQDPGEWSPYLGSAKPIACDARSAT